MVGTEITDTFAAMLQNQKPYNIRKNVGQDSLIMMKFVNLQI